MTSPSDTNTNIKPHNQGYLHSAERDTEEFPEGGRGWLVVAGTFVIMATSFGMAASYGEYQKYYVTMFPTTPQSTLALVGSTQPFLIYFCAIPSTVFIKKVGPQVAVAVSGLILVFSLMMTSLCTKVWQLALAQGLLFGVGSSISVFVSYTVPQQWFKKKRAAAVGIVASGSAIGGLLCPIALNNLTSKFGFPWANRIIGFIYIPLMAFATITIKSREIGTQGQANRDSENNDAEKTVGVDGSALEAAKDTRGDIYHVSSQPNSIFIDTSFDKEDAENLCIQNSAPKADENNASCCKNKNWLSRHIFHSKFLIDWSVLKEWHFVLIVASNAIGFFGLFPPLLFFSSFAQYLSINEGVKTYILTITSSGSVIGRIIPGFIGDKIGRLNMLILAILGAGIVLLAFWIPTRNDALMIITGVGYGICSGALVSLAPATLGQLFGIHGLQSRLSILFLMCSPGALLGAFICGTFLPLSSSKILLNEHSNGGGGSSSTSDYAKTLEQVLGGYRNIAIFSGVLFLVCAAGLIFTRFSINRRFWVFV